jgi:ferredoxin
VLPADVDLTVDDGETLLDAALRHGWKWPTLCNGDGECGLCHVSVEAGEQYLNPMGSPERQRLKLGLAAGDPAARLACQIRIHDGTVRVRRRGARPRARGDRRTIPGS